MMTLSATSVLIYLIQLTALILTSRAFQRACGTYVDVLGFKVDWAEGDDSIPLPLQPKMHGPPWGW